MGLLTAAIAMMGVGQAATSLTAGMAASSEAKYNAKIKEQQAQMVDVSKGMAAASNEREINRAGATLTSRVAKSGLMMSGSPLTALIDLQTQMEMDNKIEQFNYDVQKRQVLSEANAYKRQASAAAYSGVTNAFSTLMQTGAYYGMAKMQYPTSSGATKAGKQ